MGRERGSATLLALIMMILLGSMGITLIMLSNTDLQIASNHRDGIAAQYLAEAGIQSSASRLKTDDDFVSLTGTVNGVTISQSLDTLPTAGSYTAHTRLDPQLNNTQTRLITATGMVNQAKRQISAHITLPMPSGEISPLIIIWDY